MSFGQKVREYRKRSGMRQNALAERIGIHPEYLGDIERGRYTSTTVKTLRSIIEALQLSSEEANDLILEAFYSNKQH